MKKTALIWIAVVALILVAVPLFSAAAQDKLPSPIDPQSWALNRDRVWGDHHPNPVIDWMTELNTDSIVRPSGLPNANLKTPIRGGLILVDYLDRKFISRGAVGSDPLGYCLFDAEGGTGLANTVSNNPLISATQLLADEKYGGDLSQVTDADFAQWWADFLNKPQELNRYTTIDEYWREMSYGKWAIDLTPFGPFTIPYFEFETIGYDQSSSFQTYRDVPPSFRRGTAGTTNMWTFDSIAIPFARDNGVPFVNLDFFFMLHAGYDESGVWQEFGMSQFSNRKDIPYELGPGPRMKQVEEFFTANPGWLTTYAARYSSGNAPAANVTFWANERNKYNALVTAGTPQLYEFHLPQADWDWVDTYNDITQRNTRYVAFTSWEAAVGEWSHMSTASAANTGAGRTIRYSTQGENDSMGTFAHEFGHIAELPDNYGSPWVDTRSPLTEPWDVMSRGGMGGPGDDHTRWTVPGVFAGTIPVHETLRNKLVSKYYDAAVNNPSNTIQANGASASDLLEVRVQDLAAGTPVVAEVVPRHIPLNNKGYYPQLEQYGLKSPNFYKGIHLTFATSGTYMDQATRVQTGWSWTPTARATWMAVEVVDNSGYDSFAPDHGVILTRIANESGGTGNGSTWNVIDSHLYDISMIDYVVPGLNGAPDDYVAYTLGHHNQLWDASFHAGKSVVDTGYYKTQYDPADPRYSQATPRFYDSSFNLQWKKAMLKTGSITRWEPRGGREIASGDTVNEFHDTVNKLHFYILAKNTHDGRTLPGKTAPEQFISYTVGVLRDDGQAVGGDLNVGLGQIEKESPGRVAVANYTITNTGNATDIIRVAVDGELSPLCLNDLYAVGAGETIIVPVYVELPVDIRTRNMGGKLITVSASSETNGAKVGSASVPVEELIAYNYNVYMTPSKSQLFVGETLLVDVMLTGDTNYTQFLADVTYDPALLKCEGYSNMTGFVTACAPTGPGTIGIRCIPSTNMITGAPSSPGVKIVTLEFTVLKTLAAEQANTALNFSNIVVNPPAGYLFTGTPSGQPVPLTIYKVGNENFQELLAKFPRLYDPAKGVTQPVFDLAAANVIHEEVWVEVPVETFATGQKQYATDQRDLICIRITRPRPADPNYPHAADPAHPTGVTKVPVMMVHSPYRGNNQPSLDYNKAVTKNHPNTEFIASPVTIDGVEHTGRPYGVNPDTSNYTYADVKSTRLRLADWPFADAAYADSYYHIPASRGAKPVVMANTFASGAIGSGTLSPENYAFTRGFAVVQTSMGGNRYSLSASSATAGPFNDGLNTYGETYEMLAGLAAIKWLNGECRGYKTKAATEEVVAYWASGDVAMTGQSYVGTTTMGVASSGDPHLKAIVPRAGISNMYEYFRKNGAVYPGASAQGEDAEWLSRYDMARWLDPNFALGMADRNAYEAIMARIADEIERETGDYNKFWDMGNWAASAGIYKAAVLFMQGFDDRNVGTQHFDQLYRALKEIDPNYPIKGLLHLQNHTSPFNWGTGDFLGTYHKWLDRFVYGIDNGIDTNGIAVWVANNVTGECNTYAQWPAGGSDMSRYYFGADGAGGGQLLTGAPASVVEGPFADPLSYRTRADISVAGDPFYNMAVVNDHNTSSTNWWYNLEDWLQGAWETSMLFPTGRPASGFPDDRFAYVTVDQSELLKHTGARLAYVSEPLSAPVTLSGTARVTLDITPDKGTGSLSVMIVDLGNAPRNYQTSSNVTALQIPAFTNGYNAYNRFQYTFANTVTPYKIVARSSVDIQNPNPSGVTYLDTNITKNSAFMAPFSYQTAVITPDQPYSYTFTLEPRHYTFRPGCRLAVVVYSTDYKHTIRPFTATQFQLRLGSGSYIDLPLLSPLPQAAPLPAPVIEEILELEEITEIVETLETVQIDVNSGDALEIEIVE